MIPATYQLMKHTCLSFVSILLIRLPKALAAHIHVRDTHEHTVLLIVVYWSLFWATIAPAWQLHLTVCHLLFMQIRLRSRSEA